jgi:hypothetical protein
VRVSADESRTSQTVTSSDVAVYRWSAKAEGKTPGFWKSNADNKGAAAWPRTPDGTLVYDPYQTLASVFWAVPAEYADLTLYEALSNGGGGIEALLRQAVAALLSATQPYVAYPLTPVQVIALTNEAILSGSATRIGTQKDEFDRYNNYEADIDQFGRPPVTPTDPPVTPPPAPALPSLSVSDVAVSEGRSGSTTVSVTITLSAASTSTVTVTVGISGGTATAGTDYSGGSSVVLTFSPGQTSTTFSISVRGDRTPEPDETVQISLSAVSATATIADGLGVITIGNDDGSPLLATAVGAGGGMILTTAVARGSLAAALEWWERSGVDTSALGGVEVVVEDLGEAALGAAQDAALIALDDDAAGWGWTRELLLRVLIHELGHLLGFEHSDGGVMDSDLDVGRLASATATAVAVAAGGSARGSGSTNPLPSPALTAHPLSNLQLLRVAHDRSAAASLDGASFSSATTLPAQIVAARVSTPGSAAALPARPAPRAHAVAGRRGRPGR